MPTTNRNEPLHVLLLEATGVEPRWTSDVRANCFGWLHLSHPEKLEDAARALAGKMRLCTITAYAEERDDANKRRRIAYHFTTGDTVVTVTVPLYDPESMAKLPVPSITPWFLNADWNEREFMEMFNIEIIGHPNPKRLFLDERLDAGIMTRLIPFSAMAFGVASNTLWERVLEAKGVPMEERKPSLARPADPIKVEPKVTPVAATAPPAEAPATLASVASATASAPTPDENGKQADKPAPKAGAAESTDPPVQTPAPPVQASPPPAPEATEPEAAPRAMPPAAATPPVQDATMPEAPAPQAAAPAAPAPPVQAPPAPEATEPASPAPEAAQRDATAQESPAAGTTAQATADAPARPLAAMPGPDAKPRGRAGKSAPRGKSGKGSRTSSKK